MSAMIVDEAQTAGVRQLVVHLAADTHRRLKCAATNQGHTMAGVIRQLVIGYVREYERKTGTRRDG